MKLVLASRNRHKIAEWQTILRQYAENVELLSLEDVGIVGEIDENGETFEDNALIKALAAADSGYVGIGEDSGLWVNALNGEPGVYSARYAGEHGNDAANNAYLLKRLEGKTDRSAKFVCVIACVDPKDSSHPLFFRGESEGVMLEQLQGEGGFGYDPLFFCESAGKTFAQMSETEKNAVSHRGRAIARFAEALKNGRIHE
ncbi:MAG: RdgB/HAM1 family non-canonical purine NTP pyrophosphatase [Clostridia bacterium]|nr:RdgB/HAM1 family non-canonical purine NTP pyrophosphatase [Clostridia bacterium]